ncbi:amino acid ABC transporter permease [Nodularia spumigena CS-584]|jgi:general L-amino acid transport system permease protein|uniref:General L-amino acid transport system permease protein n=2 Tax=Nodularia spumigena TaxID=70799 RepID=A0A2S0Q3H0_NODSP|nr:amino acid ABC transporter permease [Nodularia spumigena]AHJ31413.1 amino acid ABC transporter, permease protein [Nodularia spumigena CCY9414]AVZ30996.1 general L-amino acid transport system permease protein [Nodularia spumigena UHCC 0039]EAW45809.1 Amino acid ABC transporter, permease protein, 3-TM region,His/Glu/Gln/Arg/opine [Nodularia spumigena CCY9414]MDB9384046.1 amino acid ABC transporter permease [Nodularia spumigena CS-584]MEA5526981.1 amino acid ABC transporter permease [Nodularia
MTKLTWLRKNLFSSWYNSLLTVVCLLVLFWMVWGLLNWAITQAQWTVIWVNLRLFLVGRFPQTLYWRVWIVVAIASTFSAITVSVFFGKQQLTKPLVVGYALISGFLLVILPWDLTSRLWLLLIAVLLLAGFWLGSRFDQIIAPWLSLAWLLSFPVILWLLGGGFGLQAVSTNLWNGLLLTLLMASVSIVLSFPIGVLLALGRTSYLPVVRWFCIFYIEIVRGLPLIGILFLAQVMLPLFLPTELRLDRLLRGVAGLVLFSAAYMAENLRGGLQAIPRGQVEAAKALGLNTPLVVILIILPQALRAVIPAIVGQFIGLFKDTSLLSLVGLVELTGISRSILAQPQFLGRYAEVYLFIGLIYWIFCYLMSLASRRLERQLNISQ